MAGAVARGVAVTVPAAVAVSQFPLRITYFVMCILYIPIFVVIFDSFVYY